MGLVATMVALVLGLLVASAKNFYDAQSNELTQMSANVNLLDRALAHYCNAPHCFVGAGVKVFRGRRGYLVRLFRGLRTDKLRKLNCSISD